MTSPRNDRGPWLAAATIPLTPAPNSRDAASHVNTLKVEAELRNTVIDRMITAGLSARKPALEATLEQWRTIGARNSQPAGPKAG